MSINSNVQIIIDPGHGGTETGAVANGYKEKDLNLEISLELARVLRGYFSAVLMTRTKDEYFDLSRRAMGRSMGKKGYLSWSMTLMLVSGFCGRYR